MKKLTLLLFLISVSGCTSIKSMATFRDKKIFAGQSNDSVEKSLGSPDWSVNAQIDKSNLKASKIDPWITAGKFTIEWGYWDEPKTLIIWLERNSVVGMWLTDTSKFPEAAPKK